MVDTVNADQAAYWNDVVGPTWVELQQDLDVLHAGVLDLLMDAAAPAPGEHAIDIGCGAGASTFAVAQAVGPGGGVLGVDIAAPLLDRAEARRRAHRLENVAFVRADAQLHDFEAGTGDLAVSRFGVMFFADPAAAFANIGRALRPGGRLVFAAWAGPEENPWFALGREVAEARLGAGVPAPPDAPGPMAFRDRDRVAGILREAGLSAVRAEPAAVDQAHPGGIEAVVRLGLRLGPAARRMAEAGAGPDDRAAVAEGLARAFAPFASDDGVRIPAAITLFSAMRP